MLLLIDAGNTNIVFALYDGEAMLGQWRISTDTKRTADEYAIWLMQLLELNHLSALDIDTAILASVVPQVLFDLKLLCSRYFDTDLMVVGDAGVKVDMQAHIDAPEELGADRLVNAYAAWKTYGAPLIVVDFGTATTFDVVNAAGNYIGGVIAPGVNLSLDALTKAAAKLPNISITAPDKAIGTNTVSAMQSGIYYGYVGLVEGILNRIRAELAHKNIKVIATGGLSALYAQDIPAIEAIEPDLTIRGLYEIAKLNQKLEINP